jgi:lipopolysaccharide/colanic/teichoic acid biosynthesis glycosyltransferase
VKRDSTLRAQRAMSATESQYAGLRDIANDSRFRATPAGADPISLVPDTRRAAVPLDEVLCRAHFLKQIQRERRRADRSKSPLSIALFRFDGNTKNAMRSVDKLVKIIFDRKRETDILGDLGNGLIAVLLPDTDAAGTHYFAHSIAERAAPLPFARCSATYPDQLFESLAAIPAGPQQLTTAVFGEPSRNSALSRGVKRLIDLFGATAALIVFSPLMMTAAIAVACTSRGPVIFKQVRLGRGAVPFVFYKFRTMYCNADDRIHREHVERLIKAGAQNGPSAQSTWSKLSADPRITPLGALLRKTSIDELPQLFNVVKGDLSLVGPRPALPYEAENYQSWHLRRIFDRKPGISGLWQACSRGESTFDDMVRMDIQYIRNWSIALDIKILIKTIMVVLRRTGAG